MRKTGGEQQLSFDFMHTMPLQRKPSAERDDYLAYLKTIREPPFVFNKTSSAPEAYCRNTQKEGSRR
jgi:hypothetical protein